MNYASTFMLGLVSIVEWPTASKLFKRYDSDKEYQDLNDFKKVHGQTSIVPVVCCQVPESDEANPKFYLIDGYNRIEAAKRAGEKFIRADEYTYQDEKEMEAHAIALNAKRRHLDAVTASRLALRLVELYKPSKAETKAKQSSNAKNQHTSKKEGSTTPVVQPSKKKKSSIEKAAKEVGVSPETVRKVKAIDKSGNKEIIKAVETKKMSIKEGFKKVSAPKKKELSEKNRNAWKTGIDAFHFIEGKLSHIYDSFLLLDDEEQKEKYLYNCVLLRDKFDVFICSMSKKKKAS